MASIFNNKFFSMAGQKERLTNVVKTIGAAVLPGGAKVASTLNPTSKVGKIANKVLETAAANPFATAAVGAIAAKPKVAVAAAKEVIKAVNNVVKGSPKTSAVGTATATTTAQQIISSKNNVMPGQSAGSTADMIPGQPVGGGQYSLPSNTSVGGTEGSTDFGTGSGELTSNVAAAEAGKPVNVPTARREDWGDAPGDYTGVEMPVNNVQQLIGSPGSIGDFNSPNNSVTKFYKRQALTMPKQGRVTQKKTKRKNTYRRQKKSRKGSSRKSKKSNSSSKKGFGTEKQYKRKGGKTVHYTKNRQPYIILASGKARFIKKTRR